MNKNAILQQVETIVHSDQTRDEKLRAVCTLLNDEIDVFDWSGFYLVSPEEDEMLVLGPYVGKPTTHIHIPFGKGICGQAAETLETFVVQDVSQADNYLACDIHVQSEIVVPIMKDNKFVGELDIDSCTKDAITPELKDLCEEVSKSLSPVF